MPRVARAARLSGLYAVTPDLADTADLVARVEAALEGGAGAIQYRNKSADAALRFRQAATLGVPVVAIGGITADNAREMELAGAHAVAVISAVFDAPDVEAAARAIAGPQEPT